MLRELVDHEVRPSSTFTINADLCLGVLFSGGVVESFRKIYEVYLISHLIHVLQISAVLRGGVLSLSWLQCGTISTT